MGRVAIVTDSASDLTADVAAAHGIRVVPLYVRFGETEFRAGVDLSTDEFWARMVAPDAPFPTTAAASPGDFQAAFEAELAAGADAIVCVTVGGKLSATIKSAELAAQGLPGREIHVVDSNSASMGVGLLALLAAELAAAGVPAAEIAAEVRAADRGHRPLRGARHDRVPPQGRPHLAGPGRHRHGPLDQADHHRGRRARRDGRQGADPGQGPGTRDRAPDRACRSSGSRSSTPRRATSTASGPRCWRACPAASTRAHVSTEVVGASVGPHVGPGCVGAVVLLRR